MKCIMHIYRCTSSMHPFNGVMGCYGQMCFAHFELGTKQIVLDFLMVKHLKYKSFHNYLHGCLPSFSRTLPRNNQYLIFFQKSFIGLKDRFDTNSIFTWKIFPSSPFLDTIVCPSPYPCQWMGQFWGVMLSHLRAMRAC